MPSGLTYKISNGEDMSLRGFALACVTQLGAGYMATEQASKPMPLDNAPVRKPSDCYENMLRDCEEKLKKWLNLKDNLNEAVIIQDSEIEGHIKANEDYADSQREIEKRYLDMKRRVEEWDVPDEYNSLKELMLKQLDDSIKFDCSYKEPLYHVERIPVEEFVQSHIDHEIENYEYYKKELDMEKKRVEECNAYIKGLYDELDKVEPLNKN